MRKMYDITKLELMSNDVDNQTGEALYQIKDLQKSTPILLGLLSFFVLVIILLVALTLVVYIQDENTLADMFLSGGYITQSEYNDMVLESRAENLKWVIISSSVFITFLTSLFLSIIKLIKRKKQKKALEDSVDSCVERIISTIETDCQLKEMNNIYSEGQDVSIEVFTGVDVSQYRHHRLSVSDDKVNILFSNPNLVGIESSKWKKKYSYVNSVNSNLIELKREELKSLKYVGDKHIYNDISKAEIVKNARTNKQEVKIKTNLKVDDQRKVILGTKDRTIIFSNYNAYVKLLEHFPELNQ